MIFPALVRSHVCLHFSFKCLLLSRVFASATCFVFSLCVRSKSGSIFQKGEKFENHFENKSTSRKTRKHMKNQNTENGSKGTQKKTRPSSAFPQQNRSKKFRHMHMRSTQSHSFLKEKEKSDTRFLGYEQQKRTQKCSKSKTKHREHKKKRTKRKQRKSTSSYFFVKEPLFFYYSRPNSQFLSSSLCFYITNHGFFLHFVHDRI